MRKNSKFLAIVLAFAMVLSMAVIPVSADDYTLENIVGKITGVKDGYITAENGVKASDAANTPSFGNPSNATFTYADGAVYVERTSSAGAIDGVRYLSAGLKSGRTYLIKASIKAGGSVSENSIARFNMQPREGSLAAVASGNENSGEDIGQKNISTTEWTHLSTTYTPGKNPSGTAELGMNVRLKVGSNANAFQLPYYVKNFAIYDVTDIASSKNLLIAGSENPGFEDGALSTAQSSNGSATVTDEAGAAHTGYWGAKVQQTSWSIHNLRTADVVRNTDANQWYRAGAWVKAVDDDSVGKAAWIRVQVRNAANSDWITKEDVSGAIKLSKEWQFISYEAAAAAGRTMRFAPMFGGDGIAVNAYVDDLVLEAFTPAACTVTTDMEDDAVDQATEVEINYTFSNELSAALAVENFTVTPEGAIVAVDGNKLTLSGLDNGTEYTVALANATDKYGQNVSDTLSFTTVAAAYDEEVLWGFEGSYNNENYSGSIHTGTTGTISTDVKYAGNQSLQVVTDGKAYTDDNSWKPDVIAQNKCTNIELGVPYIVSYYAKTAEGTNRVGLNVSSTRTANNTVQVAATKYATFEINDKEWTKVTCYVVAKAGNGAEKLGLHMAIFARKAGTYYVDQLEIKKATALDLDGSYYAVKSKNAVSGDVELSLYTAAAKTVYLLAAQYEGENFVGAKLDKVDLTDKASYTATLSGVGENDRIFVWDGSLKPLNKELKLTDF